MVDSETVIGKDDFLYVTYIYIGFNRNFMVSMSVMFQFPGVVIVLFF